MPFKIKLVKISFFKNYVYEIQRLKQNYEATPYNDVRYVDQADVSTAFRVLSNMHNMRAKNLHD